MMEIILIFLLLLLGGHSFFCDENAFDKKSGYKYYTSSSIDEFGKVYLGKKYTKKDHQKETLLIILCIIIFIFIYSCVLQ